MTFALCFCFKRLFKDFDLWTSNLWSKYSAPKLKVQSNWIALTEDRKLSWTLIYSVRHQNEKIHSSSCNNKCWTLQSTLLYSCPDYFGNYFVTWLTTNDYEGFLSFKNSAIITGHEFHKKICRIRIWFLLSTIKSKVRSLKKSSLKLSYCWCLVLKQRLYLLLKILKAETYLTVKILDWKIVAMISLTSNMIILAKR